jgi:hypothetical protein
MSVRAVAHFVKRWLGLCGEACCVGRSQTALSRTLDKRRV